MVLQLSDKISVSWHFILVTWLVVWEWINEDINIILTPHHTTSKWLSLKSNSNPGIFWIWNLSDLLFSLLFSQYSVHWVERLRPWPKHLRLDEEVVRWKIIAGQRWGWWTSGQALSFYWNGPAAEHYPSPGATWCLVQYNNLKLVCHISLGIFWDVLLINASLC